MLPFLVMRSELAGKHETTFSSLIAYRWFISSQAVTNPFQEILVWVTKAETISFDIIIVSSLFR